MNRHTLIFFVLSMLLSCNSKEVYSDYKSLPSQWPLDQSLEFVLPQTDSLSKYNLFFTIRNTNEYKYSNLFLIASMNFPNGKVITDTLEYQMANPDGTWLGTGTSVKENKLWYKENIRFFEDGTYKVKLRHAMRNNASVSGVNKLQGITDVGIIVEKSQSPR